jgi:hypothetical protein
MAQLLSRERVVRPTDEWTADRSIRRPIARVACNRTEIRVVGGPMVRLGDKQTAVQ